MTRLSVLHSVHESKDLMNCQDVYLFNLWVPDFGHSENLKLSTFISFGLENLLNFKCVNWPANKLSKSTLEAFVWILRIVT